MTLIVSNADGKVIGRIRLVNGVLHGSNPGVQSIADSAARRAGSAARAYAGLDGTSNGYVSISAGEEPDVSLAQVRPYQRTERGRRERVGGYVTRRPGGWIPQEKWQQGQRDWVIRGEVAWAAGRTARLQELEGEVAKGLKGKPDADQPSQGQQSTVAVVDLDDDGRIIDKGGLRRDVADREKLAYYLSEAVGAGAPEVVKVDDGKVVEDFVPGTLLSSWMDRKEWTPDAQRQIYESERGRRIGLLDYLSGNQDRHGGNVIVAEGDIPVPIDHGNAFGPLPPISNFWFEDATDGSNEAKQWWVEHPQLLAEVETRLQAIKPEFQAAGQLLWWRKAEARLRALITEAAQAGQKAA